MRWPDDVPVFGWHLLAAIPCLWAAIFVVDYILVGFVFAAGGDGYSPGMSTLRSFTGSLLTMVCMAVLMLLAGGSGFLRSYHVLRVSLRWLLLGLGIGLVMPIGYELLATTVWPHDRYADEFRVAGGNPANLLMFSVTALAAGFFEELYYRGLLYPVLRRLLGSAGAMVVVTIWFGAVHLWGYGDAPLAMAFVTLFGLGAVLLRHFSRSVVPGMVAHVTYGAVASALTCTAVHWP